MCMLGAIAVGALGVPGDGDSVQAVVARLVASDDEVAAVALPLLLICAFAIALSTMSALFSAGLCTIQYDLLVAARPEEATAPRRTLLAGGGFGLVFAAVFLVAAAFLDIHFPSSTFLALLFAFACAQLALAPLVLGPIVGRTRAGAVSPGWALATLGAGAAGGVAPVIAYLATGTETWLWAPVPACCGSGLALYAVARVASRGTA
jgi:hypothetical protein